MIFYTVSLLRSCSLLLTSPYHTLRSSFAFISLFHLLTYPYLLSSTPASHELHLAKFPLVFLKCFPVYSSSLANYYSLHTSSYTTSFPSHPYVCLQQIAPCLTYLISIIVSLLIFLSTVHALPYAVRFFPSFTCRPSRQGRAAGGEKRAARSEGQVRSGRENWLARALIIPASPAPPRQKRSIAAGHEAKWM